MKAFVALVPLFLALTSQATVRLNSARLVNVGSDFVSYVCGVEDLSDYGDCAYPRTVTPVLRISIVDEVTNNDQYFMDHYSILVPQTYTFEFATEHFSVEQLETLTSTDFQAAQRLFTELFVVNGGSVSLKRDAP